MVTIFYKMESSKLRIEVESLGVKINKRHQRVPTFNTNVIHCERNTPSFLRFLPPNLYILPAIGKLYKPELSRTDYM